jgi:replicative DNA helicase Mcm
MPAEQAEQATVERKSSENPFVEKFSAFFAAQYKKEIERLVESYPEKRSLEADFALLQQFDYQLADELIESPDFLLEAAEQALERIDIPALEVKEFKPHVRFKNLPKDREKLIRDIGSADLGKIISVEGVVRQITDVLPRLLVAAWKCRRCGNVYRIEQQSQEIKMPAFCECRHRDFELVTEQSTFIDSQKIQIQEPLERLRGSEQAVYLDTHAVDDLVNKISVGDKTRFVGVLRLRPGKEGKVVYGRFLSVIHLEETEKEFEEVEVSPEEEKEIQKLARNPKIYEMLAASVAPAIYGHDVVKESIILQLFGGVKKYLPGEQTIRGNIHVLLVGDPSTGKSQMLQAANNIAPKSIYTSGKTTSGVGLTASAVKDDFGEGGWTLKAGALVLSSGGVCMADELDKMDPEDRYALHEAMEQGMISVAKAGIVTRFKAETSILAAANPKFSRFDQYTPFIEQVNLPPTLISRFDLFFMIKDVLDRTRDEAISAHILQIHKSGEIISQYKKKGKTLSKQQQQEIEEIAAPAIGPDLLSKYLSYARQNIFPALTDEAIATISDFYVNLRDLGRKEGSYTATHRQLEGLVRLSEASARVRLSDTAEKEDAERAIRLVKASLNDVVTDPETGKIDYDIIATGVTHTQITNMKKILGIVQNKAREMDAVPVQDVLTEAEAEGISKDKARDLIAKLEKNGELYRPRHDLLKPTQKE